MNFISQQKGFIRMIVIIIIAIIVLSYYGIDLQKAVESTQTQKNFTYTKALVVTVWERYLRGPAEYLWFIYTEYIWGPALEALIRLKNGESLVPPNTGPQVHFLNTQSRP